MPPGSLKIEREESPETGRCTRGSGKADGQGWSGTQEKRDGRTLRNQERDKILRISRGLRASNKIASSPGPLPGGLNHNHAQGGETAEE